MITLITGGSHSDRRELATALKNYQEDESYKVQIIKVTDHAWSYVRKHDTDESILIDDGELKNELEFDRLFEITTKKFKINEKVLVAVRINSSKSHSNINITSAKLNDPSAIKVSGFITKVFSNRVQVGFWWGSFDKHAIDFDYNYDDVMKVE